MYPLLLKPAVKDYLWGGNKLKTEYQIETEKEIAAEAWMLSCHRDGECTVLNGEHKGKTLSETMAIFGKQCPQKNAEKFSYFPLLIKLIDAKDKLSIQVHPDDEYALKNEGEVGKTEMWYVVECDEGAELIYGFNKEISNEEFKSRIEDNTLTEVCNFVPVNKGDVFFIESGTLHAIGAGILIAEVQQNSNTTYRVSDYGRLGADGKPRELHVDKALDVTRTERPRLPYGQIGKITEFEYGTERELADCEFFKVWLLKLEGEKTIFNPDSLTSVIVLDGKVEVCSDNEQFSAKKGESLLIPANFETKINGKAELLVSSY